ncbi:glycosyltransferase family 2 protein [Antarcticibacterium sp. 1MA-6-2]|uniref:glycosyltransferase family 2 protein n=1 Tax=Antarcticibacterium sp. 1MA-6-2 TaxID=2908210 RepID=UPI001F2A9D94|nr:glycosyltransferase family A protein [Antarcticibacterium sp. 1MA-6-2]UJH92504.1 glycosyltransferase family 2 protein [Antarcticibacterium sp. 1MA-6-2]
MILLVHKRAANITEVWKGTERINFSKDLCQCFWQLAEEFPDEVIVWVEEDIFPFFRPEGLQDILAHNRVMLSYAVKTKFLSGEIGFVDQLPFINIKSGVKYPTWRMSSDVGGIKAATLLKFKKHFLNIIDFNYLLNSIAKVGQQNGLFCYSHPGLVKSTVESKPVATAGTKHLFSFVYQHYNTIWLFVLFFCMLKYEKKFPLWSLFGSFFNTKFFGKEVDLLKTEKRPDNLTEDILKKIDVIIPTIGRPEYLKQVVGDLSQQTLLPERVIIVEQQPEANVGSELDDFLKKEWPFQVVHIFTHRTYSMMARNKALKKVKSEWIFLPMMIFGWQRIFSLKLLMKLFV